MTKSVVLADPRGFCAGVDRAILTVQTILKAAEASGKRTREDGLPPVYVRRQIVHNKHVVEDLAGQGAVFVQELAEIPDAAARSGAEPFTPCVQRGNPILIHEDGGSLKYE